MLTQRPRSPLCNRNLGRRNWTSNLRPRQPPASNVSADERATLTAYVLSFSSRLCKVQTRASRQLIYKVRNGSSIEDAVEDIITRGIGELRKNAFGDDSEDAKDLPWSRTQAWGLMKRLAKEGEVRVSISSMLPHALSCDYRSHTTTR